MIADILIACVILMLILYIAYCVFLVCNDNFLTYENTQAKVIGKLYNPAYTKTYLQPVMIGKTMTLIPMNSQQSEKFCLEVEVNQQTGLLEVTKKDYEKIKENELVNVKYALTRFTKELKFKGR